MYIWGYRLTLTCLMYLGKNTENMFLNLSLRYSDPSIFVSYASFHNHCLYYGFFSKIQISQYVWLILKSKIYNDIKP